MEPVTPRELIQLVSNPNEAGHRTRFTVRLPACVAQHIEVLDAEGTTIHTIACQEDVPLFEILLRSIDVNQLRPGGLPAARVTRTLVPAAATLDAVGLSADNQDSALWRRIEIKVPTRIAAEGGSQAGPSVTIAMEAAEGPSSGWLHFDLALTFPSSEGFVWERSIDFPRFNIQDATKYVALLPSGWACGLAVVPSGYLDSLMTTQMGAIYQHDLTTGSLAGFILSSDDERGHRKRLLLHVGDKDSSGNRIAALASRLHLPVFLAKVGEGLEAAVEGSFTLSGGDDQGFGGARMHWRLMGFAHHSQRPFAKAPVDWEDVAALYRNDLLRRDVAFMRPSAQLGDRTIEKDPPRTFRKMSPHTVLTNYAFEGPAEVGEAGENVEVAQMLEMNPFRVQAMGNLADTDVQPGAMSKPPHPGESLQNLAYRLISLLAEWRFLGVDTATGGGADPILFSVKAGRVDLLYQAINEYVWQHYEATDEGAARDPVDIGGQLGWDGDSVVKPPENRGLGVASRLVAERGAWGRHVELFALSSSGLMRNRWSRGELTGWETVCPMDASGAPGVVMLRNSTLVAGTGGTGPGVAVIEVDVSQAGEVTRIPGTAGATGRPALACLGTNEIVCLYRMGSGLFEVRRTDGTWGIPRALPSLPAARFGSSPAACSGEAGRIDVAVCDDERRVWHTHVWSGGAWADWTLIDASVRTWGDPAIHADRPGRIDVAVQPATRDGDQWTPAGGVARWTFASNIDLECQLWGIEMGAPYRWLGGFPATTDVMTGQIEWDGTLTPSNKLRHAVKEMRANRCHPLMTTCPQATPWDMPQMSGLPVKEGEGLVPAIAAPLPGKLCAATWATTDANARTFNASTITTGHPVDDGVVMLHATIGSSRRMDEGASQTSTPPYDGHVFQQSDLDLCPQPVLTDAYLSDLERYVFPAGMCDAVEYMCHHPDNWWCYDPTHEHSPPAPAREYDTVIGPGPWYFDRMCELMVGLRTRALRWQKEKGLDLGFAISHEFEVPDVLIPYVDEVYINDSSSIEAWSGPGWVSWDVALGDAPKDPAHRVRVAPLFRYVHAPRIMAKMTMVDNHPFDPPGYWETMREDAKGPLGMLAPERDDDLGISVKDWRKLAKADLNRACSGFKAGLAPRKVGGYTFRSGLQQIANLRSAIFRFGVAAVQGERIYISAPYMARGKNHKGRLLPYNVPALEMACRGIAMQATHAVFFRDGRMLGRTRVDVKGTSGAYSAPRAIGAWRVRRRNFAHVAELAAWYAAKRGGSPPQNIIEPSCRGFRDPSPTAPRVDEIVQMVWERDAGLLYVLANVSNTDRDVRVHFVRGVAQPQDWELTVRVFGDVMEVTGPTAMHLWSVEVRILARSIVTLELSPASDDG